MASDPSSFFFFFLIPDQGYHTFLYGHTNPTEKVEEKEPMNKHGLGSAPSVRKRSLYNTFLAAFRAFVDFRGSVFGAKVVQSHKEC